MKILLLGKNGQVGWELQRALAPLGELIALGRQDADLENHDSLRRIVRDARPGAIVNAGAYTAVDKAESEPDKARRINAGAPGVLAEEAKRLNAWLVHYSTDYVFDGQKSSPYDEDDAVHPLSVYGRTKLEGEQAIRHAAPAHLIFRTS
ncbi:MAG: NAD(P)-dependent oxidoreductase, partial [Noviherbaspirillum sp.]|nr:NAD(P)-dependent oxidoreductase [Noviherbaspirillum sp.]